MSLITVSLLLFTTQSSLHTFSQETKEQLRKFRLTTSRASKPQAMICMYDPLHPLRFVSYVFLPLLFTYIYDMVPLVGHPCSPAALATPYHIAPGTAVSYDVIKSESQTTY